MFKKTVSLALGILLTTGCLLTAQTAADNSPRAVMPEILDLQKEISKLKDNQYDLQKTLLQGSSLPADQLEKIKSLETELAELKKAKDAAPAVAAGTAAAPADTADISKLANSVADWIAVNPNKVGYSVNIVWTLLAGFIVMFMQAGFALVETGFTRAKNVAHTMSMNFMVYTLGMLGFWFSGFAIMFGGTGAGFGTENPLSVSTIVSLGPEVAQHLNSLLGVHLGEKFWGFMGGVGFCLPPSMLSGGIFALFLFQMVFMDTTATIPTGSMAERWKFLPFCVTSFIIGAFIYPLYGCWVWGGGWLAALGLNLELGHGHVDFAGSSVVHLTGGVLALVGSKILGPRIGKFNKNGTPNPIPGHNIPMAMLGTFILAFGWFGFNPGSTLSGMDTQIAVIATNTMLATASGAVVGMVVTWIRFGKPDPSFMCNGLLAGAVAITAPCAFVESWAAVFIGVVAGGLVVFAAYFVEEKLKIDDPVGAVAVHGFNGLWGCLALGLFANGRYGAGWNLVGATTYKGEEVVPGVSGGVTGLFYGDASQLLAQMVGVSVNIIAVGLMAWGMFVALDKLFGLRSASADELGGLDVPELGVLGYQPDVHPESK